ncbi:MAG: hypothetical protein QOG91_553 [Candidatus Parcubacteria bacterium]|jgi:hypothetical protein|nr:hypothetical protein [Candidatus Parcubacteria bacterium]
MGNKKAPRERSVNGGIKDRLCLEDYAGVGVGVEVEP